MFGKASRLVPRACFKGLQIPRVMPKRYSWLFQKEQWKAQYLFLANSGLVLFQVCHGSGNLAHLSKLYEMYLEKTYHRPRSTWMDSVCRYINDSFGHLTRSHITFLLEVISCNNWERIGIAVEPGGMEVKGQISGFGTLTFSGVLSPTCALLWWYLSITP